MSSTESLPPEVAPWIEALARLGYAAKALLYCTIGLLAAKAAFGSSGKVTDMQGALRTVERQSFGDAFLILIAIGLFGYAAWRLVEAVFDPERRGTNLKGLAVRAGLAARGLIHGALGVTALRLVSGHGGGRSGNQAKEWTSRGLQLPGGELLVAAAGLAIGGYGLYQLYRAWAAKLGRQLQLSQVSEPLRSWVVGVSRFGIAARGVVFCLIGFFLARSGLRHDPAQAGGLRESLHTIAGIGRWPFAAVSIGLVAYGVYQLINARYRHMTVAVSS
jgi:hypothetical protein